MRIIVIGSGRMGTELARVLTSRGHSITVIDRSPAAIDRLQRFYQVRAIVGSGLDRDVLLDAGIERADGLAVMTDSDETNVVAARIARLLFHVPRVVARLYDLDRVDVYQRLGIQIVAPDHWAVNRFADLLSYSALDTVLSLGKGEVEILEMEAPALLVGRKASAIEIHGQVRVIAVVRKGKAFLPTADTVLREGDSMHLALLTTSAERLKSMLALT